MFCLALISFYGRDTCRDSQISLSMYTPFFLFSSLLLLLFSFFSLSNVLLFTKRLSRKRIPLFLLFGFHCFFSYLTCLKYSSAFSLFPLFLLLTRLVCLFILFERVAVSYSSISCLFFPPLQSSLLKDASC